MSMYAYEDEERTKEITANVAAQRDRNIRYYCSNKKCQAKIYIWGVNGEKSAYFRSKGEPGHIEGCFASSKENSYNPNDTIIDDFDANDTISKMMIPERKQSGTRKTKQKAGLGNGEADLIIPHTIRQVYDVVNNQKIGYILYDERSAYMYPKGIFGNRLIEAKCMSYFYDKNSVFLETPITEAKYQLELKIKDLKLLKDIREKLFNNRNNVIVVAGNWQPSGTWNRFATDFNTMKQIKILRQTI